MSNSHSVYRFRRGHSHVSGIGGGGGGGGGSGTVRPCAAPSPDPPATPCDPSRCPFPCGGDVRMAMSPSAFFWILMVPCFSSSWIFFSRLLCFWMALSFSFTILRRVCTWELASLYTSCHHREHEFCVKTGFPKLGFANSWWFMRELLFQRQFWHFHQRLWRQTFVSLEWCTTMSIEECVLRKYSTHWFKSTFGFCVDFKGKIL